MAIQSHACSWTRRAASHTRIQMKPFKPFGRTRNHTTGTTKVPWNDYGVYPTTQNFAHTDFGKGRVRGFCLAKCWALGELTVFEVTINEWSMAIAVGSQILNGDQKRNKSIGSMQMADSRHLLLPTSGKPLSINLSPAKRQISSWLEQEEVFATRLPIGCHFDATTAMHSSTRRVSSPTIDFTCLSSLSLDQFHSLPLLRKGSVKRRYFRRAKGDTK